MSTKSFKLTGWNYKFSRVAVRFGLLSEACLALLLLPILRRMALFQLLGVRFEASVRYHTWLGTAMIFFSTFHGAGTIFIWGIKHHIQEEMWKWQKTGRVYLAGEIALVTGLVIWITSLQQMRRKQFEIFYYTHHLYIVFLLFVLFHVGDRHFYMVFPGVFLFGLDKLFRVIQSRPETCILSARIFPCRAIELTLPKDPRLKYTPTSMIFVKIPTISKLQWHSFSITSSSSVDDHTMSIIIKCEGWWTSTLFNMIQGEVNSYADKKKCIPIAVEGPYGPASVDYLRYDCLLLIGGGIGITPFLSMLQEINHSCSGNRNRFPTNIQLICVVKKAHDISLLNPISPLFLTQSTKQLHLKLKVFVTQQQQYGATVRDLLQEFYRMETLNFDTKCSQYATHGLERLFWMAAMTGFSTIVFIVLLSCLRHVILHPEKKAFKQKSPSWVADLLLMCSFVMAILCGSLVAVTLRWRRLRKEIPLNSDKEDTTKELNLWEDALEEHEIYFGGRPNFPDIFSKFPNESWGSKIGVVVSGPESMKESVASLCRLNSQSLRMCAENKKPHFSFHPLNFTL
ncbi:ferric reduction oxidase 8, mitochondrial isoform X2 [Malania oleifera]|nr:ferric reduction oxidase 8, mitochondrial isoform X2 [Malania oleifera]